MDKASGGRKISDSIVGRGLAPAVCCFPQDPIGRSKPLPYSMIERFPVPGKVDFTVGKRWRERKSVCIYASCIQVSQQTKSCANYMRTTLSLSRYREQGKESGKT